MIRIKFRRQKVSVFIADVPVLENQTSPFSKAGTAENGADMKDG